MSIVWVWDLFYLRYHLRRRRAARLGLQQGSCPQSTRTFHLCCASIHDFCVRRCTFFLLIDTSEQFSFGTLHIHMFGVCSTEKGPFYMPQEAETCLLCFAVCHAVARLGGVFLSRLCSSAGSTPLQLNRFGCIQIRSGCNRCSDDHTVTAHGRSRARQGSYGARDVDSGVADQLACSCRGSVGEVAQSYARKRSRPMFCGYRCAYFRLPSPSTSCSGPIPNLCYAFCFP